MWCVGGMRWEHVCVLSDEDEGGLNGDVRL